jgi:hypothetical protein
MFSETLVICIQIRITNQKTNIDIFTAVRTSGLNFESNTDCGKRLELKSSHRLGLGDPNCSNEDFRITSRLPEL